MLELEQLSRTIGSQIDTRFAKLEAAINDADRRIAVLQRLNRQLGEKADGVQESDGQTEEQTGGGDEYEVRHAVIYELADAGFTPVEIARDLGKTPGEVELILNLRKKNQQQSFQGKAGKNKNPSDSRRNTQSL